MNTQNVYILEDRGILYINGADTKEFLQNIISNDINKVNENNSCFASLLSPQGKFLFAFIIFLLFICFCYFLFFICFCYF